MGLHTPAQTHIAHRRKTKNKHCKNASWLSGLLLLLLLLNEYTPAMRLRDTNTSTTKRNKNTQQKPYYLALNYFPTFAQLWLHTVCFLLPSANLSHNRCLYTCLYIVISLPIFFSFFAFIVYSRAWLRSTRNLHTRAFAFSLNSLTATSRVCFARRRTLLSLVAHTPWHVCRTLVCFVGTVQFAVFWCRPPKNSGQMC